MKKKLAAFKDLVEELDIEKINELDQQTRQHVLISCLKKAGIEKDELHFVDYALVKIFRVSEE